MLTLFRKLVSRCAFNIPCKVVYVSLSAVYAMSCVGLDKTTVAVAAAVAYLALALARSH